MEIRARYIQMGVFALFVLVAGFAFVYWLNNAGALRDRAVYRVLFEGSVSGLQRGSAVLFNGIRVGEVTRLDLDGAAPRQVHVTIAVSRGVPVRADTLVFIDFQGLTGSPVVALAGGKSDQPLASIKDAPPLLLADATAGQSMSQTARDVLRRLDGVLTQNAEPLHSVIGNLEIFSGALARNADRLDGIVAGLERMTGGAAAKTRLVSYDLTDPRPLHGATTPSLAQLVVADPIALAALDSERIQMVSANGSYASLPDAQWSDALPKLIQLKLLRALEDAGGFAGVSRPMEGVTGDLQLVLDLRKFQIGPNLAAEVEIGSKLLGSNGRIVATRTFRASLPAEGHGAPASVAALDKAFNQVGGDLLVWTAQAANEPSAPRAVAPKRSGGG
jgi:phospholipid/cholesterol/gamma-HCH transport system substrate-binding protein